MKKRIAIIGDVHGCIEELTELLDRLREERVDEILHLGDLVDRGPDSGAVVALMRQLGVQGVMGNHEAKLLDLMQKGSAIRDDERRRTVESLSTASANWDYLQALPRMHVLDDVLETALVLVHGGLWPGLPLWKQPYAVLMAQRIDPFRPGAVGWLSDTKARDEGMVPWWEVWDGEEAVVFGHTVFQEPLRHGRALGIDTGCVFGGTLTALILPELRYVQVKAKSVYAERHNLYQDG